MGLFQKEAATFIGVDETTVFNWEKMGVSPNLRAWPGVINFLGYDPKPVGQTVGEKLRRHREGRGLSLPEVARIMDVDPATVRKWETQPDARQNHISIPAIIRFLGYSPMPAPQSPAEEARQLRYILGLTIEQLGKKLGVYRDKIWRWEVGKSSVSEGILEKLRTLIKAKSRMRSG